MMFNLLLFNVFSTGGRQPLQQLQQPLQSANSASVGHSELPRVLPHGPALSPPTSAAAASADFGVLRSRAGKPPDENFGGSAALSHSYCSSQEGRHSWVHDPSVIPPIGGVTSIPLTPLTALDVQKELLLLPGPESRTLETPSVVPLSVVAAVPTIQTTPSRDDVARFRPSCLLADQAASGRNPCSVSSGLMRPPADPIPDV